MLAIFGYKKRPLPNVQNTGRDAFQRPFDVATVSVQGMGGANNYRSVSPVGRTTFNDAMLGIASIEGTGNALNTNPNLIPLNDKQNPLNETGAQF